MIQVMRKTIIRIALFSVASVICILIVLVLREAFEAWRAKTVSQHPRIIVSVVIDINQREKLFEQLERFSDAHDFDINIGPTTPAGETFNIYMSRKDIYIIANNPFDASKYDFAFYDKDPTKSVSKEVLDNVMTDLKKFITEVLDVKVID